MQSGRPRFYKSRFLRRTFLIGLPLLGLGYVAGSLVGLYIFTTSPERKLPVETPASVGLAYETVTFSSAASDQLKLKGWWIPHKKSDRVLILVHVKNGNRAFGLQVARPLWEQGYNLLLFDMRGHGEPEGDHYTYGRYEQFDVVGAANFVQSKGFGPRKIGAIGWSMGAATVQWHLEDIIRSPTIRPDELVGIKRRIDQSNQDRTDTVEQIDGWFFDQFRHASPKPGARLNSETPAWLLDRMSILQLKLYHFREQTERPDVTAEHRQKAEQKLAVLTEQERDLAQCFDELLEDIRMGDRYMKVYRQMKMYNDPTLNPVLYGQPTGAPSVDA